MATGRTKLAQAAEATFKVTVTQCVWAVMGCRTEPGDASGGHRERCLDIGRVPGLSRVGPQGLSVGSGGHGTAFLWTKWQCPPSPPLELRAGITTVKAACLQPLGALMS